MSWVAAMPEGERTALLEEADALVRAGETPPALGLEVVAGIALRG
jgi:hypothetical protein